MFAYCSLGIVETAYKFLKSHELSGEKWGLPFHFYRYLCVCLFLGSGVGVCACVGVIVCLYLGRCSC